MDDFLHILIRYNYISNSFLFVRHFTARVEYDERT